MRGLVSFSTSLRSGRIALLWNNTNRQLRTSAVSDDFYAAVTPAAPIPTPQYSHNLYMLFHQKECMYDIVIGRSDEDKQQLGLKGTVFLGRQYVKMGRVTSLANNIYLDVARSHVVFVVGKRGSGKSYSLAVMAEGICDLPDEIRQNLSFILLDTMGIFWTMKYPNKQDVLLLEEWNMKPKGLDPKIFTPYLFFDLYKQRGIPTDFPFSIKPSELSAADWQMTFEMNPNDPAGVLLERIINLLRESKKEFDIDDVIKLVQQDVTSERTVKGAVENRFLSTKAWGVFNKKGTALKELVQPGQITILDLSVYATMPNGWKIKSLIVGLVSQKLFVERMMARKFEEYQAVKKSIHYFGDRNQTTKLDMPLVWLLLDEAHEFLPRDEVTTATFPLTTILREGREPGISVVLASQQPGKIHTDVMTQADTVISHRVTAKMDTDALKTLMQSYMREGLDVQLDDLPRIKGAALIFDDTNERLFPMKVRPRISWHGGSAPSAIVEKEGLL